MARQNPISFTLRAARPEDAAAIVDLHAVSVRGLAAESYDAATIEKWSPAIPTPKRIDSLADRILAGDEVTVVAVDPLGELAGFGSVVPRQNLLGAVYVLPKFARMGVGMMILAALERHAIDRGVHRLEMDASVNAEPFYAAAGYVSAGHAFHELSAGGMMKCARMHKTLAHDGG